MLVSSAAVSAADLWLLVVGYGVLGGFGLGLAYIVPVALLQRWFPDRAALVTGLAVGGFGFGAVLTSPPAQALILVALPHARHPWLFLTLAALVYTCYGGAFGTLPSTAGAFFGLRHAGAIYGLMLAGWSVGGVVGPLLAASLQQQGGALLAFTVVGLVAVVASIVPLLARPPQAP